MDYYFIGDPELATAFRFIGIHGTGARSQADAQGAFRDITSGASSCRVLIVTEETADWLGEALTDWQLSGRYPLVVEIPGMMGRLPGRQRLTDAIREAVGISVGT